MVGKMKSLDELPRCFASINETSLLVNDVFVCFLFFDERIVFNEDYISYNILMYSFVETNSLPFSERWLGRLIAFKGHLEWGRESTANVLIIKS